MTVCRRLLALAGVIAAGTICGPAASFSTVSLLSPKTWAERLKLCSFELSRRAGATLGECRSQ